MLIRLSRTLFWVSAVSAGVALATPGAAGTWLTALAGIALLGSFASWRAAAARRRAEDEAADAIEMVQLGEAGALETAARLARAIAASESFDAALLAALEVLRSELGCREASVHRVLALEPPIARLVTLIDPGPAGRGVEHRVRLDQEPLGAALRDGRVAGRGAGPFALPVLVDGRPVAALELGVIALDADPAVLAALLDLAGLQLAEAARRGAPAGSEATAGNAATSRFMAGMSHEIRTPMNGILGMTELLLGTALDDRQHRFAQAVYRSGETLLETVDDILDFAALESGRPAPAPADFGLRGLVEGTLELLAARAQEKRLELSFQAESGLPAVVHGDPRRLRQVLSHLIAHATKFGEQGEIVVELRRGEPAPADGDAALVLEFAVRDSGPGVDAQAQPHLFDAFSPAGAERVGRQGGGGLGLAIARRLVELMGGTISVRSAPGIGSEFRFTVPVRAVPGEAPLEAADGELASLRVLLAEGNLTHRTVLANMLGAWGMELVLADDGAQALEILRDDRGPFDVALIDMNLPRLDGLQLARVVRRSRLRPALKLLMLSGSAAPEHERAAQEAGFDRCLAKPVRKAELRQALLRVTSSRADTPLPTIRPDKKVLVVEDNRVNQEVIGQMLRRLGCHAEVVPGATEGLRALCEESFDLILMDIQMPGMDGIEALRCFRGGGDGRVAFLTSGRTPVVAVTADAHDGDEQRYRDLGFDDYLPKPFRLSQLLAMLLRQLSPIAAPLPAADVPSAGAAPAAPAGPGAVLDPAALDKLRDLDPRGDSRLLERVMKAFETSVARLLPQLQEAHRLGDQAGIRHVVHTLKASSASIGALALSQQCAEIETRIRLGEADGMDARIEAVYAELENVLKALRPWTDGKA